MNVELSEALAADPQPQEETSPRLRRIRKLSRIFRMVSRLMILVTVLLAITPPILRLIEGIPVSKVHLSVYPFGMLILYASGLLVAVMLERMFNAFATYGVFHAAGARWLKWLGGVFLGFGIYQLVMSVVAALTNDWPFFPVTLLNIFSMILLGAFILMLGWALEEACELKDQQEHTI